MSTDKRTPSNVLDDMENPLGEIEGLVKAIQMIFADDAHGADLGYAMNAMTKALQRKLDDMHEFHSEAYGLLSQGEGRIGKTA